MDDAAPERIRELATLEDLSAASDLVRTVWAERVPSLHVPLLRAMSKSGHYMAGAFVGDQLVGASIGFPAQPFGDALHSHLTAILPVWAGRGIGRRMKRHQRDWCRERGLRTIRWTFDPLVARNAHFNLCTLGATGVEYLPDFYGTLVDGINVGAPSDRLLVAWGVDASPVPRSTPSEAVVAVLVCTDAGEPVLRPAPDARLVSLAVPVDIETVRRRDPAQALRWSRAFRDSLGELLVEGGRIVTFDPDRGYIIERTT